MRFKAILVNPEGLNNILRAVQRIGKTCIVHLSNRIKFIMNTDMSNGVQVWSGMPVNYLFEDYNIESVNENNIAFTISLDNLIKAVKSSFGAQTITVKLTKKNGMPCLSFVIDFHQKRFMTVTQDVPIQLLSPLALAELIEPKLDDPEVYITLPNPISIKIKPVVERMKNVGEFLTIEANMNGCLELKMETDMVSITTRYKNLTHPTMDGKSPPPRDANINSKIKVNIKKFMSFLYSSAVEPEAVVMCFIPDRALVIHVLCGEGNEMFMTYYIPVIVSD